ncbi:hypothetical protein ACLUW2_05240 [Limosilactobacillus balticus]|uniref:hypothetical protein n=1 Tax=Limosilactobacillus balticus TaxID=2759747 RepID=UPI0039914B68
METTKITDQMQDALEDILYNDDDIKGLLFSLHDALANIHVIVSKYKNIDDIPVDIQSMAVQELLERSTSIFALLRSIKILINQNDEVANKAKKRYMGI